MVEWCMCGLLIVGLWVQILAKAKYAPFYFYIFYALETLTNEKGFE